MVEIGFPAVEPLINYLRSRLTHADSATVENILSRIGSPAVEPLIAELTHYNYIPSWKIAAILGNIRDKRAVKPLILALKEEPYSNSISDALVELGDESAIEPLIFAMRNGNSNAINALGRWRGKWKPSEFLSEFIEALKNKDYRVRTEAAKVCGQIGSAEAVEPLIKLLSDHEMYVCAAGARALAKIGDPRAIQPLRDALVHNDFVSTEDLYKGETENPANIAYREALRILSLDLS